MQRRFNSVLAEGAQLRTTNTLKRARFDLKYYYDNYDLFKEACKKREMPFSLSDGYKDYYDQLKSLQAEILSTKQKLNRMNKQMKSLIIDEKKKSIDRSLEKVATAKIIRELKEPLAEKDGMVIELEDRLTAEASCLPNLIHSSVASKQKLVKYLNPTKEILDSGLDDFLLTPNEQLDHKDIMERLGLVDFKEATRVSGRGWYYLKGDAALLEQALVQYALKLARKSGFRMIIPPSMIKTEVTNACGFRPRDQNDEKQVYEIVADESSSNRLCLTGTAEIALAGLLSNHEFKESELPLHYAGVSRSYREEAGAAGRDTRGLYRVHEFTKVELFSWCKGDETLSMKRFDELAEFQMHFIESLGLTARVLIMPFNDLGAPAYKKIDIEALMPGRGAWGELTSVSNCLDYQSRRLTTQYREDGKLKYVHTLNATACAVPRVILAIVENFYDPATGSIVIPEVLRPYMDDKERIVKQ
ncbi:DEKNAAC101780 [Brettanomyces naardenensis]|uniref:serine--tRNA ligase n=1 Tax=Brettanomyces naardenensis TaxID=13370 RepID=A0A448YIV6_BRENA|nr:DEKNAAC101780 [Brettanomyces naardenensis]